MSVLQTTHQRHGRGQKRKQRDANENEESYVNKEETVIEHQSNIVLTNNDQDKIELSDQSDPESDVEI